MMVLIVMISLVVVMSMVIMTLMKQSRHVNMMFSQYHGQDDIDTTPNGSNAAHEWSIYRIGLGWMNQSFDGLELGSWSKTGRQLSVSLLCPTIFTKHTHLYLLQHLSK